MYSINEKTPNKTKESELTPKMIERVKFYLGFSKKYARLFDILKMRLKSKSLQSIADKYGISRERIRQLELHAIKVVEQCNLQIPSR